MNEQVSVSICNTYHPNELAGAITGALDLIGFTFPQKAPVLLKPNALAANTPDQATGTHPAMVEALCRLLADRGCAITIGDSSAYYQPSYTRRAFETLGFAEVARHHGAELLCFEEQPFRKLERPHSQAAPWLYITELDRFELIINLPKLKVHRVTRISGAAKNLFGLIPGGIKQIYHELLKTSPEYLEQLGTLINDVYLHSRPGLNILDGVVGLERDGPAANGDPRRTRFILASRDALSLDVALCRLIGEDIARVPYLRDALRRDLVTPGAVRLVGEPPSIGFKLLEEFPPSNFLKQRAMELILRNLMVRPRISHRRCQKCGTCAERCQAGALRLTDRLEIDMDKCLYCYGCPSFCSNGALRLEGSPLFSFLQVLRRIKGV